MIGFFFKKAFFDGWDNLFSLAAFNVVHIILLAVFIALPLALGAGETVVAVCMVAGIIALSLWQANTAFAMNEVSDYKSIGFKASFADFGKAWKPGLVVGLVNVAVVFSLLIGIPFYMAQEGFLGVFFASLLFWVCLIVVLASQYFLPLIARRGGGIKKNAKVAMILFMDNIGFTFFLFLYNIITLVVSVFVAFLAPGLAGIALAGADAVKLRLKKYDWLEENPEADKKHVPWATLLEEEKELVGVRTLKGMIFPWKEGK